MSIAKVIEISAESSKSYDDAIAKGLEAAGRTVQNIRSAWVQDHEVLVKDGSISEHRVHLKVTFVVSDASR